MLVAGLRRVKDPLYLAKVVAGQSFFILLTNYELKMKISALEY